MSEPRRAVPSSEITELARRELGEEDPVHVAPAIPEDVEASLRAAHAYLPADEEILVAYDGGGGDGLAVTSERLCWRRPVHHPRQIAWHELRPAMIAEAHSGVEIARGLVDIAPRREAAVAAFLTAIAASAEARSRGPYRDAPVDVEPPDPGTVPARRIVAIAREIMGEVDVIRYHPTFEPELVAEVRERHRRILTKAERIAAIYDAGSSPRLVMTERRLCLGASDERPHQHLWKHLEPHTIRVHDGSVRVMGMAVVLVIADDAGAALVELLRRVAREAGSEDLT